MSEKSHARFSPSKLEAKEQCLKFDRVEGEVAEEGQLLHKAYETGDLTGLDEEQRQQVEKVIHYTESLKASVPGMKEHKEVKLTVPDRTWGFADRILVDGEELSFHVIDAKFGRKQVTDAELNFQIQCYVAGAFEMFPKAQRGSGHIVSPRLNHSTMFEFKREDVPAIHRRIDALYKRLSDPFSPPTPNDELCSFCKHASRCPALNKVVVAVSAKLGLPLPAQFDPSSLMSDTDRAIAQLLVGALKNWAEQVSEKNNEYVRQKGSTLPGFKWMERSLGLKIPKERTIAAIEAMEANGYATIREIVASARISIPDLAKAMAEFRGTTEAEEKERLRTVLTGIATEDRTAYLQKERKTDLAAILKAAENAKALPEGGKT